MTKKKLPKSVVNLFIVVAVMIAWTAGIYAIAVIISWIAPPGDPNEPPMDDVCTTQPLVPENCSN